jgi:hypothetical protein
MKILYFHCGYKHEINDAFIEFKNGMKYAGVSEMTCPREINYKDIKGYNLLLLDDPSQFLYKYLKYYPKMNNVDIPVYIITMDWFVHMQNKSFTKFCNENNTRDGVIFRHSAGMECYLSNWHPLANARSRECTPFDKNSIKNKSIYDMNFKQGLLTSFTIDKNRMKLIDGKYKKHYDICIGCRRADMYPLRYIVTKVVSKYFKTIDPPFEMVVNGPRSPITPYYEAIAQSYFTISTSGIGNTSVRKYYEISALGGAIIGNHTHLPDTEMIKDIVVDLGSEWTLQRFDEQKILDQIADALRNKKYYTEKAEEIKHQVREYYDYREVTKRLIDDLRNII